MTAPKIPPVVGHIAREVAASLGRIGHRAVSAAVATALEAAGEVSEEIDRRIKRGARGAQRMAKTGEPYQRERDEEPEVIEESEEDE
jgi:hypothetical protein